jgi:hypothetical protein
MASATKGDAAKNREKQKQASAHFLQTRGCVTNGCTLRLKITSPERFVKLTAFLLHNGAATIRRRF